MVEQRGTVTVKIVARGGCCFLRKLADIFEKVRAQLIHMLTIIKVEYITSIILVFFNGTAVFFIVYTVY